MDKSTFFELATKILAGEASTAEQEKFNSYLRNEEYLKLYNWLREEWQKELKYKPGEFDLERGLRKLRSKITDATEADTRQQSSILSLKRVLQVAASLLVLVSISILVYRLNAPHHVIQQTDRVTVSAKRGERKTFELPDGSAVSLNSGATIQYPAAFSGDLREIHLTGEAFFDVTTDKKRPFVVTAGGFETTVLGTSFDINHTDGMISVTVETGRVRVAKSGRHEEVILEKGQQATFDRSADRFRKTAVIAAKYTEWKDHTLRFDEITVGEAFEKMEAWYNVTIQCDSAALLNRTIKGTYHNESLQNVLDDLAFMIDMTYTYQSADTLIIH